MVTIRVNILAAFIDIHPFGFLKIALRILKMRIATPSFIRVSLGSIAKATLIHYPPRVTNINNFTFVMQGTGALGIFNSSFTPPQQYGEYNWCNMPHVRTTEYKYVLVYSEHDVLRIER